MKGFLDEYDQLRNHITREAAEREERQRISSQDQSEARIADILTFAVPNEKLTEASPRLLPAPPLEESE